MADVPLPEVRCRKTEPPRSLTHLPTMRGLHFPTFIERIPRPVPHTALSEMFKANRVSSG